jgi:hypothetical protein
MFSSPDVNNRFFFSETGRTDPGIRLATTIFNIFPTFPVSICFGALIKKGSTHMDKETFQWVKGKPVTWDDFHQDIKGRLADGVHYVMPSPWKSMQILFIDMFIFLVLTWYFDHTLSHNRGVAE